MGLFSKPGKHAAIKPDPDDARWNFYADGAKSAAKWAERQRKLGLHKMAEESEKVAEARRRELKGWC